jgi:iron complex transport system substrate-binding protein
MRLPPFNLSALRRPALIALVLAGILIGCGKAPSESASPATRPGAPTVASLVPAATDLLIAMGRSDRLVAVSNYDTPRGLDRVLPKVGDYQTTDWEQIRAIRPAVMVRQFAPDRVPPGLKERCAELDIRLVNLRIGRLREVFAAIDTLGEAVEAKQDAAALAAKIEGQLAGVRKRVAGRPAPRVLLVRDEIAEQVIGPGEFLDDLLAIAGATNAAGHLGSPYPAIDRETLRAIDPDIIIQLLPDAAPQRVDLAKRNWQSLSHLKAVRNGRVRTLTEWYLLQPGAHVGDIAEQFARLIHSDALSSSAAPCLRVPAVRSHFFNSSPRG